MGGLSITHILILLIIAVLLLGKGKVSGLMGDVASGIKAFKKNMADEDKDASMEASETKPAGSIAPPGTTASGTAAKQPQTHA